MIVKSLDALMSVLKTLPTIPLSSLKVTRKSRPLPIGSVVHMSTERHGVSINNPARMWGYIRHRDHGDWFSVAWSNGAVNNYWTSDLCTLEEFMSEHGNVLPFSWRN